MSEPNWVPLEKVLPPDECGDWMWMGRVERGHRVIEQYKHCNTRRYLNLDQDGQAWQISFAADALTPAPDVDPIPLADALEWALR